MIYYLLKPMTSFVLILQHDNNLTTKNVQYNVILFYNILSKLNL